MPSSLNAQGSEAVMMQRTVRCFVIASGLLALAACNAAPPAAVAVSPPPAEKARLYVYRDATIYGSQQWTAVSLDRVRLGDLPPGAVFFRDLAPGRYEIEVRSDKLYPEQFKTAALASGSITFVKIQEQEHWSQSGFGQKGTTFIVVLVDSALGAVEIGQLRLIPG
jgi:hypothetical protein